MRSFLLAATLLVPFAAFAGGADLSMADGNLAKTSASSTAGVQSSQGTQAQANAAGNGGVIVGAVSGNYSSVGTTALGKTGLAGSYTNTTATQANIGATVAAGLAINQAGGSTPMALFGGHGQANGAAGSAGGLQSSQAAGSSSATATDANLSTSKQAHGR